MIEHAKNDCARLLADLEEELSTIRASVTEHSLQTAEKPPAAGLLRAPPKAEPTPLRPAGALPPLLRQPTTPDGPEHT